MVLRTCDTCTKRVSLESISLCRKIDFPDISYGIMKNYTNVFTSPNTCIYIVKTDFVIYNERLLLEVLLHSYRFSLICTITLPFIY